MTATTQTKGTTTMSLLEKIRSQAVAEKAAKLLNVSPKKVRKVTESYDGASVSLSNGNRVAIPYEVWVLGMSEQEYTKLRFQ